MVTSPFFTFKTQPYVGEIPIFWAGQMAEQITNFGEISAFSRCLRCPGTPFANWSIPSFRGSLKTWAPWKLGQKRTEVRRSGDPKWRFQQHWSGWWWLEPWNFEWLSHDIGNGKSSQLTNKHIFQTGWLKPPTSYSLNWNLFGYINSVILGFKLPENDVLFGIEVGA